MLSVRCSSLPLYLRCAQSALGEINVNEWYPETALGTAVHEAAKLWLTTGLEPDLAAVASVHAVDLDDLTFLFGQLRRAWAQIAPPPTDKLHIEIPADYVISEALQLTGTADVVIERNAGDVLEVLDWKSGRRDADYREQMMGYCALALRAFPYSSRCLARIVWLREMEVEMYSLARSELVAWEDRLVKQAEDTLYRPGPHCSWCPRQFACGARRDMQSASLAILGAAGDRTLETMAPSEQLSLYRRAKDVAQLAKRVLDEMRTIVENTGAVEADGVRLEIVPEKKRNILPAAAWPVLQKHLTEDGIAASITVHITKAEDEVAANKPRGEGASAKRAFNADLEAAGAVRIHIVKKLTERRSRP